MFVLSLEEVNRYLKTLDKRKCKPTEIAKKQGALNTESCCWWLRTVGKDAKLCAVVNSDGSINEQGMGVDYTSVTVRPVIKIKI